MKHLITIIALLSWATNPLLAQIAVDSSANYTATFIGLNQGSGFNAWTSSPTGSGGNYIGASGLSASSFAIFSGGGAGNSSEATRVFSNVLNVGDTFSIQLGYTGVATGGEIGLNLFSGSAASNFRLGFKFIGGGTGWVLNDGGSDFGTGLSWQGGTPGTPISFSFTRNAGNGYGLNITHGAQSYTNNNMTSTSGIMSVDRVQIYSSAQGSGENVGFNNLQIIPEPSSASLIGLGLAGLLALRRSRRI